MRFIGWAMKTGWVPMKLLCLLLALIAAVPQTSFASDETMLWKEVGGWTVAADLTLGSACFVATAFEDRTLFRLGFNFLDKDHPFYILMVNDNWKSLEEGKQYPIELYLDRSKWTVDASAVVFNGEKGLRIDFKDTNLVSEFAVKLGFRADFNGKRIVALSLKNSVKAIDEMIACQKAVDAVLAKQPKPPQSKDPFDAKPDAQTASDPFEL
jgi:hypothetical protein